MNVYNIWNLKIDRTLEIMIIKYNNLIALEERKKECK